MGFHSLAKDTVGSTPAQKTTLREGMTDLLRTIQQMPPDQPVKLVTDEKDKICESCAIGKHCGKPKQIRADRGYLALFEERARARGLEESLVVQFDEAGRPRSITAPSSTVKAVSEDVTITRSLTTEIKQIVREKLITSSTPRHSVG